MTLRWTNVFTAREKRGYGDRVGKYCLSTGNQPPPNIVCRGLYCMC